MEPSTRSKIIASLLQIQKFEGSFDPYMMYVSCLTDKQQFAWRAKMIPLFIDFLEADLSNDELEELVNQIDEQFGCCRHTISGADMVGC